MPSMYTCKIPPPHLPLHHTSKHIFYVIAPVLSYEVKIIASKIDWIEVKKF